MNTGNHIFTTHNLDRETKSRTSSFLLPYNHERDAMITSPIPLKNLPRKPLPEDIGTAVILWIVALAGNTFSNIFSFPNHDQMLQIAQDMNMNYSQHGNKNITSTSLLAGMILALSGVIIVTAIAIWRYARASRSAVMILSFGAILTVLNAVNAFISQIPTLAAITVIIAAVASMGAFLITHTKESKKFFGVIADSQK